MAIIPVVWILLLLSIIYTESQDPVTNTKPLHIEFNVIYNKLSINEIQHILLIDQMLLSILHKSDNPHLITSDHYKHKISIHI